MQITISKISYTDKKKDGTSCISKNGKPFYKVGIQTNEFGDTWINGLIFDNPPTWKEGDKIDLIIKDEEYNGITSKKFELPKPANIQGEKLDKVMVELSFIKHQLERIAAVVVKDDYPTPEQEGLDPNKVPFD